MEELVSDVENQHRAIVIEEAGSQFGKALKASGAMAASGVSKAKRSVRPWSALDHHPLRKPLKRPASEKVCYHKQKC